LHEPIQHGFGFRDFKPCPQSAAGVNQRNQILRILANRLFKQPQRIVEAVELPEGTRLLQLGDINAQSRNDRRWLLGSGDEIRRTKILVTALAHGSIGDYQRTTPC